MIISFAKTTAVLGSASPSRCADAVAIGADELTFGSFVQSLGPKTRARKQLRNGRSLHANVVELKRIGMRCGATVGTLSTEQVDEHSLALGSSSVGRLSKRCRTLLVISAAQFINGIAILSQPSTLCRAMVLWMLTNPAFASSLHFVRVLGAPALIAVAYILCVVIAPLLVGFTDALRMTLAIAALSLAILSAAMLIRTAHAYREFSRKQA